MDLLFKASVCKNTPQPVAVVPSGNPKCSLHDAEALNSQSPALGWTCTHTNIYTFSLNQSLSERYRSILLKPRLSDMSTCYHLWALRYTIHQTVTGFVWGWCY